jgi:hypothetical protein
MPHLVKKNFLRVSVSCLAFESEIRSKIRHLTKTITAMKERASGWPRERKDLRFSSQPFLAFFEAPIFRSELFYNQYLAKNSTGC